jgi:hypothetical protein
LSAAGKISKNNVFFAQNSCGFRLTWCIKCSWAPTKVIWARLTAGELRQVGLWHVPRPAWYTILDSQDVNGPTQANTKWAILPQANPCPAQAQHWVIGLGLGNWPSILARPTLTWLENPTHWHPDLIGADIIM